MRDWDILTQLARNNNNNNNSSREATDNGETSPDAIKQLPDTFVGPAHYISAWAPLCLAEARAQTMSDAAAELRNCQNNDLNCFVPVKVQTAIRDSSTLDSVTVKASRREEQGKKVSFMANDLCVLIPAESRDRVELALLRGDAESSLRKHGLVGHVEFRRDSLDGLLLKVSKRWWATLGKEDMLLWKLGSNVTALREFTALCRVESIPLRRNLLGQNLVDDAHKKIAEHGNAHAMLDAMGGVNALGKGFTKYVKEKFNPSQLAAISASANQYGDGGFTLIKGPPGTGKTLTLVAVLNSLHIRQFNKYYEEVRRIAALTTGIGNRKVALSSAVRAKPRLLVCAPSNAAVDNVILKIMESGFKDGSGARYNPSMIRVGMGAGDAVRDVLLENKVDAILSENMDLARLESSISGYKMESQRIQTDLLRLRRRIHALAKASPWPLSKDWEIRIDEDTFEETGRVFFVNHKDMVTTFEVPPPPEPDETHFLATSMPEYRSFMQQIVKLVEKFNSITTKLERCTIVQSGMGNGNRNGGHSVRQQLETHILDSVHIVMTTLGTAGNRVMDAAAKFEVVVVDEAAQCVEPATLSALQLGSRHAVLVGDPQQLPATIFNVSGRNTKYDRSLFQRLEEAGHKVYMLNQQYRMHPAISHFPRFVSMLIFLVAALLIAVIEWAFSFLFA
jgi:senataxin